MGALSGALARAHRMGAETRSRTIAGWLRVVAYGREERGYLEECKLLLETASLIESGRIHEDAHDPRQEI